MRYAWPTRRSSGTGVASAAKALAARPRRRASTGPPAKPADRGCPSAGTRRSWSARCRHGRSTQARIGAGTAGTDDDLAGRRDGDEAAAACADARELDRQSADDEVVLDLEARVDERLAVDHQAMSVDVPPTSQQSSCRRPSPAEVRAGGGAGGRTREDDVDRARASLPATASSAAGSPRNSARR